MQKTLMCAIHLFDAKQTVYEVSDEELKVVGQIKLKDLPSTLVQYCYENDAEVIKLTGYKAYCEKIAKNIKEEEMTKYNKNGIEVIIE